MPYVLKYLEECPVGRWIYGKGRVYISFRKIWSSVIALAESADVPRLFEFRGGWVTLSSIPRWLSVASPKAMGWNFEGFFKLRDG